MDTVRQSRLDDRLEEELVEGTVSTSQAGEQLQWFGDRSLGFMNRLGSCRFAVLPGGRRRADETL